MFLLHIINKEHVTANELLSQQKITTTKRLPKYIRLIFNHAYTRHCEIAPFFTHNGLD